MSDHKVQCQCCGKMMVPKVILSRGIYGPVSNCCPFCLSENWDSTTTGIGWRLIAYVSIAVGLGMIFYSIKLILASIILIGGGVWILANISTIRFFSMKQLLSLFFGRDA